METLMPSLYKELVTVFKKLESHYLDARRRLQFKKINYGYFKLEMGKELLVLQSKLQLT